MTKKILIVEDERVLLGVLEEKFIHEGFDVVAAKDGEEGLEKALSTKPDLILLDIIMPKMDGLTMMERLRRSDWGKEVPVIILTNLADGENIEKALEFGSHDYLVKSDWRIDDVVNKVKTRLGIE